MNAVPVDPAVLDLATRAGFRHAWINGLPDGVTAALVRETPSPAIFLRKRWIELGPAFLPEAPGVHEAVLLGATPEAARYLLDQGVSRLTVLEKHPLLVARILSLPEAATWLESGRLRFCDPFRWFSGLEKLPVSATVFYHPVLRAVYRDLDLRLQTAVPAQPFDLVMEGELLVDDWFDTLIEKGRPSYIYPHFWMSPDQIRADLQDPRVARVWSINRIEGLEALAGATGKPYTIYEIDPDLSGIPALTTPGQPVRVFTYRESRASAYRAAGWQAGYLPLAAAPRMRSTVYAAPTMDVTFVGTSIIDNARTVLALLADHLPSGTGALLQEFVREQSAHPLEPVDRHYLHRLLEAGVPPALPVKGTRISTAKVLQEWTGAVHRIHLVQALAPFKAIVYGDSAWAEICRLSGGLAYGGPAGNRFEVPAIYRASRVNVDITRSYQPDVGTIRLFDALACGRMCVTNVTGPVAELFAGTSLPFFQTSQELQQAVETVLSWSEAEYAHHAGHLTRLVHGQHMLGHRLELMLGSGPVPANQA